MGKIHHLKDGEDFSFPSEFGFSGSAQGPRNDGPGEGTYLARQAPVIETGRIPDHMMKGGAVCKAEGGKVGKIDANGDWQIPDSEIAHKGDGFDQLKNGSFVLPPGKHGAPQANSRMSESVGRDRSTGKEVSRTPNDAYTARKLGEKAPSVRPTPRPAFGVDSEEITTRVNGPRQRGYMNRRTGDTTFDDGATVIPAKPIGKAKGGFIKDAIKKPGALHRDLGVPQGEKIPPAKIAAAAKKPGKVGQRARFAEVLKGLNSKKKD